jgi:hypothetical protein
MGYRLCDVVDDDCAICVAIVHWCKGFISFLSCCIPYLEFDCCGVVESDCLSEECSANLSSALMPDGIHTVDSR